MKQIDKNMIIADILKLDDGIAPILMDSFMHCIGCPSAQMESLKDACAVHGVDADELVTEINSYLSDK